MKKLTGKQFLELGRDAIAANVVSRLKLAKQRCRNINNRGYLDYGGRGIGYSIDLKTSLKVLVDLFIEACEQHPDEVIVMDRIDNMRGYHYNDLFKNIRFTTISENNKNAIRRDVSGDKGWSSTYPRVNYTSYDAFQRRYLAEYKAWKENEEFEWNESIRRGVDPRDFSETNQQDAELQLEKGVCPTKTKLGSIIEKRFKQ